MSHSETFFLGGEMGKKLRSYWNSCTFVSELHKLILSFAAEFVMYEASQIDKMNIELAYE